MAVGSLAGRLRSGEALISGWVALPDPLIAELVARQKFDCVTLEMQHGLQDTGSVMRSVAGVAFAGKPSLVRIPVADNAMASRVLDFGAEAVIAPMINSAADAKALVAATKYPPLGERSWGPLRAMTVLGVPDIQTQLATANRTTLAFAMVETGRALDALDDILGVDGIDGVFMGPSDLSVTLSEGREIAAMAPWLDEPIRRIADRANAMGKIAGGFAVNAARARFFIDCGYRLIGLANDQIYLSEGIKATLVGLR